MSLLESAQLESTSLPFASTSIATGAYVLSITSLPDHYATAASAPSNAIDIFSKETLQKIQTLAGHETSVTSLKSLNTIAGQNSPCLMSSGKDGSIKIWDGRANLHSIKMTNLGVNRAILACDVSADGYTVAGGSDLQRDDALIVYWDPRQPAVPLRTHGSTHSDDITAIHFAPSQNLLSASSDGLISISNPLENDEDEAVMQVGNWGCSISQVGWISSADPQIWAASDMETFSTWSGEFDQRQDIDIRGPSIHSQARTWVTDYLITCWSSGSDLGVFVGSNEGDIALLSNANLAIEDAPWTLHKLWTNGHTGVVRSLLWDEQHNVLVTGGEDSKINLWRTNTM